MCDYSCATARGLRTHYSRGWCQIENANATTPTRSTSTGTAGTSTASDDNALSLGKRGRASGEEERDDDECVNDGWEEKENDGAARKNLRMYTPPRAVPGEQEPLPLPEHVRGVPAATYAKQIKYLVMSGEIRDKIKGENLHQVARNELFLMKFCLDNGLGRDQGQQLLNWMKSVRNIDILVNI